MGDILSIMALSTNVYNVHEDTISNPAQEETVMLNDISYVMPHTEDNVSERTICLPNQFPADSSNECCLNVSVVEGGTGPIQAENDDGVYNHMVIDYAIYHSNDDLSDRVICTPLA